MGHQPNRALRGEPAVSPALSGPSTEKAPPATAWNGDAARERAPARHLIVGAGLAGGLIALALARAGRGAGVALVDRDRQIGGNHTWSFHQTDLDAAGRALVAGLVTASWPRHVVRFPGYERTIQAAYVSIDSDQFNRVLLKELSAAGVRLCLGQGVVSVGATKVHLDDASTLTGDLVIDARGPRVEGAPDERVGGFQKFVGLKLELDADGPWSAPLLMDATVPQVDGYRFTYVLPYSRRQVLVEDTIYSRNSSLDVPGCERGILAYVARHGAAVSRVLRREVGVLPLPTEAYARGPRVEDAVHPLRVGYRGGFFHDVTGYSLPLAVRVALAVAQAPTAADARHAVATLSRSLATQHRFGRLLNRLMFHAMPAPTRWTAFERFYRLPDATIARFYASRTTRWDRARVLVGRPPDGISLPRLLGARSRGPDARRDASREEES